MPLMETLMHEIAAVAAQLVVDDGLDYGAAKRRAVKQLGVPPRTALPDNDLLDALPPTEREWIKRLALEGRVDINGRVFLAEGSTSEHARVDFDLNIRAHNAMLMRDANGPAFTAINGDLFLEPARLQFADVTGRRGNATLVATGEIDWKGMRPVTSEGLIAAAPELVVMMTKGLESTGGVDGLLEKVPALAQTPAGQNRRFVTIEDALILGYGPSTAEVLNGLAVAVLAPEELA